MTSMIENPNRLALPHHRPMRRLVGAHEELDADEPDPIALRGNLRDLARINRLLGGVRLSRAAIADLARRSSLARAAPRGDPPIVRLLDVGTGGADVPLALLASWPGPGRLRIVAVDRNAAIVAAAGAIHAVGSRGDSVDLQVADGLDLPYPDESFDVAHASLVLHHLEPDEAVRLMREMSRVARVGIVVNDLSRSRLSWAGAWLMGHLLTRNRFTRNDAPLSVRRAYTSREAIEMLESAGLVAVSRRFGAFRHRWAIAAVPARRADAP